jgi:hypothetical protein
MRTLPLATESPLVRATSAEQMRVGLAPGLEQLARERFTGGMIARQFEMGAATSAAISDEERETFREAERGRRSRQAELERELVYETDQIRIGQLNSELDALLGETQAQRDEIFRSAVDDGRLLEPETVQERYGIEADRLMSPREAELIVQGRREQEIRNAIVDAGPRGLVPGALRFGTSVLTAATDPVELASMFIPVVGPARSAAMVARFGRVGGRTAIGATEGAVGSLLTEPLYYGLSQAQQLDYSMEDALFNVGAGLFLGGGIGTVAGIFSRRDLNYGDIAEATRFDNQVISGDAVELPAPPVGVRAAEPVEPVQPIEPEVAPALRFFGPDPDREQLPNTRDRGVRFHGARSSIAQIDPDYISPGDANIYGNGFYTSDAVSITEGYSRSRGSTEGVVYRIDEVGEVNPFNMEQPVPQFLIDQIREDEDLLNEALGEGPANLREFFDNVRELSPQYGLPRYEVQEIFDGIHDIFRQNGFNALDHIGGLGTGRAPHNVRIYLNAADQVRLSAVDPNNPLPDLLPPAGQERAIAQDAAARQRFREETYGFMGGRQSFELAVRMMANDASVNVELTMPRAVPRPQTLSEFVRERGGINSTDPAVRAQLDELQAAGIDPEEITRIAQEGGVVAPVGANTLQEMATLAQQRGFIDAADGVALVGALRQEAGGSFVFRRQDKRKAGQWRKYHQAENDIQAELMRREDIRSELDAIGYRDATEDEIGLLSSEMARGRTLDEAAKVIGIQAEGLRAAALAKYMESPEADRVANPQSSARVDQTPDDFDIDAAMVREEEILRQMEVDGTLTAEQRATLDAVRAIDTRTDAYIEAVQAAAICVTRT